MQNFSEIIFEKYSKYIYDTVGICFTEAKKDMLQSKLQKIVMRRKLDSYSHLYDLLTQGHDQGLLREFLNEITINKTDFFREINHFDFIKNNLNFILGKNSRINRNGEMRVWSAACSTGQEPYTIAMVLKECLAPGINTKILATDISSKVLKIALEGVYPQSIINEVDPYYLHKYFSKTGDSFRVVESIKELVTFRLFNLMERFPFNNTFDIIFCRNVMIYFDAKVQQSLLDKFYEILTPGGLLFIGHSEGLISKKHRFQYVQPTVYLK